MQVCGPEVFMPSEVIISVSNDGKEFTELKRMEHKVVKDDKVTFINFGWEGNAKALHTLSGIFRANSEVSCLQMKL